MLITYISIIILKKSISRNQSTIFGKKGHTFMWRPLTPPPIFSLSQLNYQSSQLFFGYSLLLSHWQKFLHIPCSHWIILTFVPYQLTQYTVHTARSIALISQTFTTLANQ